MIRIKTIEDEVFQDYKKPAMLIATCTCDFKCLKENGLRLSICQNSELAQMETKEISIDKIIERYMNNNITKAIIFGGLEPFLQFTEVYNFIIKFREYSSDDIVIYTGYYPNEVKPQIDILRNHKNIIVKYGRFIPNSTPRYDEVLGITLVSDNQYAEKIS